MTSADPGASAGPGADLGLLSPMRGAAGETGDAAVLRALLDAEVALVRAQAAIGAAPREAAEAVAGAAREAAFDLPGLVTRARSGGNPVIPLVEDLRAAAGPHGAYVHRGATSQDIMDTALMLVAHRTLGPVLADLGRVAGDLAGLAAAHRDTVMAARTLTQQAVPTTFGLKAAGWRKLVLDARDRLRAARDSLPAQLGGAAGTLAAFHPEPPEPGPDVVGLGEAPERPEPGPDEVGAGGDPGLRLVARFAAELGLAEPVLPWHVLRTPVADLGGALAFASGALGKVAADVLVLSRTEVGELSEGVGGGSSSMPHKRNPVRATMIAAAARQVPALAAVLYAALAAEDERPSGAWHAEWQPLRECLRLVAGAARDAAELAGGLRVHPERMRANLTLSGSTGSARALVERALKED
ncbi:3-carboxy-cis,cis-muconate cycloisomerase [Nonomuraea coxensis DSM 45129]|uniref:3-carboxy-cis,cis-muconate cycloisomerase n=1 Tax=Nonomuraea coxensis DSM 45129 TaxID=1122611 RepID=A0ABX8U675_9ACTN|nr:3-carboxy-cis,cis-muconate cycloisomerase [Nonomuraea coxensis]QYC43237.1 3-carboxy-cis,cis-muconate cycloisomerase [Nonomuraea coxensis DSM 45129]